MHKPIAEKEAPKPATNDTCTCACGEATAEKTCPKYDPPPVNVAGNETAGAQDKPLGPLSFQQGRFAGISQLN